MIPPTLRLPALIDVLLTESTFPWNVSPLAPSALTAASSSSKVTKAYPCLELCADTTAPNEEKKAASAGPAHRGATPCTKMRRRWNSLSELDVMAAPTGQDGTCSWSCRGPALLLGWDLCPVALLPSFVIFQTTELPGLTDKDT